MDWGTIGGKTGASDHRDLKMGSPSSEGMRQGTVGGTENRAWS